jgi:predicted transcriptional regulator
MHTIAVPDDIYHSLTELAASRGQTVEQLLADLIAQERWEEHAAQAYDAYHARGQGPHEVLTEEEFFRSLQTPAEDADADV